MAGAITVGDVELRGREVEVQQIKEVPYAFVADGADGSIPNEATGKLKSGHFIGIGYKAGSTVPNGLLCSITDKNGVELLGDITTALDDAERKFSSHDKPIPFVGDLTINLDQTATKVSSADGTIYIYVI